MDQRYQTKQKEEIQNNLQRLILNDQTLTNLELYGYQMRNEEIEALSESLKVNQTLTRLNLTRTEIGFEAMQVLCECLKVNQSPYQPEPFLE